MIITINIGLITNISDLIKNVEYVILDGFIDKKQRNLLQINECRKDFFQFIHDKSVWNRMKSGKMKLSWVHHNDGDRE